MLFFLLFGHILHNQLFLLQLIQEINTIYTYIFTYFFILTLQQQNLLIQFTNLLSICIQNTAVSPAFVSPIYIKFINISF